MDDIIQCWNGSTFGTIGGRTPCEVGTEMLDGVACGCSA